MFVNMILNVTLVGFLIWHIKLHETGYTEVSYKSIKVSINMFLVQFFCATALTLFYKTNVTSLQYIFDLSMPCLNIIHPFIFHDHK